jgi:hypothetical protein
MRLREVNNSNSYFGSGLKSRKAKFMCPFVNTRRVNTCTPFRSLIWTKSFASLQ